jgi:glycosyltransferase involved in cell wall biosynthesis
MHLASDVRDVISLPSSKMGVSPAGCRACRRALTAGTPRIVLAPLRGPGPRCRHAASRFNACKSDLKYLETALCCVPVAASRVGQHAETIHDGQNGFLAATDEEWVAKLEVLIGDPDRRAAMGRAANADVLAHRRTDHMGAALLRALAEA